MNRVKVQKYFYALFGKRRAALYLLEILSGHAALQLDVHQIRPLAIFLSMFLVQYSEGATPPQTASSLLEMPGILNYNFFKCRFSSRLKADPANDATIIATNEKSRSFLNSSRAQASFTGFKRQFNISEFSQSCTVMTV